MIIDTFLFNNEFDMLDIRIELTKHWVDKWIVCEATRTLSGKIKPLWLSQNLDRYQHLGNRLEVLVLEVPETWTNWDIENGQRAHIATALHESHSIVMHSDLDEIINPELVPELLEFLNTNNQPVSCTLDMYMYRFDQKLERKWNGNVLARRSHFEDPCQLYKGLGTGVGRSQKKKNRSHCVTFPQTAGWHWGWMGSDTVLANKVESCIETQNRNPDQILKDLHRLDMASAINHKCVTHYQANPGYPPTVDQVLRKYPYWS